jgi:O-Antigen ligase
MNIDWILGVGVGLSEATQLRLPGLPIGPGGALIALWIFLSFLRLTASGGIPLTTVSLRFLTFWAAFALALSVGACQAVLTQDRLTDAAEMAHDGFAYLLAAAMVFLATATEDAVGRLGRIAWVMMAVWSVGLLVQLGVGFGMFRLPPVSPWFWDRLRGWSENPNQLAIYSGIAVPIGIDLVATTEWPAAKAAALAMTALSVTAGRLTKSDTFMLVMVVAGVALVVLRLRAWLVVPAHMAGLRYPAAVLAIVGAVAAAVLAVPHVQATKVEHFVFSMDKEQNKTKTEETVDLRLHLWHEALDRGLRAWSLGLGPGPHLPRPNTLAYQFLPKPFEAHDTYLDVYLQGGMIAVAALLALFACAGASAWRSRRDGLVVVAVVVAVFGVPHFILRLPMVWFALMLCMAAEAQQRTGAAKQPTRQEA